MVERFTTPQGDELAFEYTEGSEPLVVFLGGFKSDMTGSKAVALQQACDMSGQAFLRFDYLGHGKSAGAFREGTIGRWKDNALELIRHVMAEGGHKKVVLVGSSMGGWLMLHVALALKTKVAALVGIAAAPDFTEELIWQAFTPQQQAEVMSKGEVLLPSCSGEEPYPITKALIEDGREQMLLDSGKLDAITCPVRLLHGTLDEDVPHSVSLRLMDALGSTDVQVSLIKGGNHRLSEPEQLAQIVQTVFSVA